METFLALAEAIKCFGIKNISLKISSRDFLKNFLESFDIADIKSFMTCLDKQDKIGFDGVLEELKQKGFDASICQNILNILENEDQFTSYCQDKPNLLDIVTQINEIINLTKPFLKDINVYFCKTLVRGFDYYTGTVFEFYSQDLDSTIAGGGRYDSLTSIFNGNQVPACGGSIGIERIFGLLDDKEQGNIKNSVLIALFDPAMKSDCLDLLNYLAQNNINSEIYLEADKLGDQIKYALSKGCKYLIIYGPDEKAKGIVTIKNLQTKEQKETTRENILKEIIF